MIASLSQWWLCMALLALAALLDLRAARPRDPRMRRAIANWAVQLIVYAVTTLITRALAPKPKPPEPGKADIPDVKEGKAPIEIYGAVWIKEPFLASWKQLDPPEPIRMKGGKK